MARNHSQGKKPNLKKVRAHIERLAREARAEKLHDPFKGGYINPIGELVEAVNFFGSDFSRVHHNPRQYLQEAKENALTLKLHAIATKKVIAHLRKEVKRLGGNVDLGTNGALDWLAMIADDLGAIVLNAESALSRIGGDHG